MFFTHSGHPGRGVRLGYCLNIHPAEDVAGVIDGMRRITVPLRDRLGATSSFGVGMYLSARAAKELSSSTEKRELLGNFLREHGLDPFTYNAFPYGDFQVDGLKTGVFEPAWSDETRLRYTAMVAELAVHFADWSDDSRHLSISTHTGGHSSRFRRDDDLDRGVRNFVDATGFLERLSRETSKRVVLALEPEPRANCNDQGELALWRERIVASRAAELGTRAAFDAHLGACVDACHAAVEFEAPEDALGNAVALRAPLGKLQYTSALRLVDPNSNAKARERLFALDEPRFLHQVTGRGPNGFARVGDLAEVRAAWERGDWNWRRSDEWRCHFHVPVDLENSGVEGLGTTREYADRLLDLALERSDRWGVRELHVELETYTWEILPSEARGRGELVDGLEREYHHALERLRVAGWKRA